MPGKSSVVEALKQKNDIGDCIIYGKDSLRHQLAKPYNCAELGSVHYHGRKDSLEHGSEDVEDITEQPYYNELYRQPIGTASLEVLYDLRRKNHH